VGSVALCETILLVVGFFAFLLVVGSLWFVFNPCNL
jgi:hypothetical protein